MSNPVRIFIAIPTDDGARSDFWQSIVTLITKKNNIFPPDVTFDYGTLAGDSLITRARNNLTHDFLHKTEDDYLLFLDSDLQFTPEDIKRLVDNRKEDAVVCGQYALKQPELRFCWNPLAGQVTGPDGLLKVREAGTGCMLIPRKLLEKFREEFSALEYIDDIFKDKRMSFFDVGVIPVSKEKSRYYSEDYLFCRRVRQLGFSVYVDTEILMLHHGWIAYPLSDDFLIKAIVSRAPTPELLQSYLEDIDKAAKEQWKPPCLPDTQKPSENSKA